MAIMEWLQAWLIVNALFVVWRVLVVSNETRDRSTAECQKLPTSE